MSTWFSSEVSCPSCGRVFSGRFVRGANVARSPELGVAARTGMLNRCSCPSCGAMHAGAAPLLYADTARGQWVAVAPRARLATWREVEKELLVAMQHLSSPQVRVVFDLDELRERLTIWDAGLDDSVVECVKMRCLAEAPTIRASGERLRVRAVCEARSLSVVVLTPAGAQTASFEVPGAVVDDVASDRTWVDRFPELFDVGFVSIDRYLS